MWATCLFLAVAILSLHSYVSADVSSESVSSAAEANRQFTIEMLKQLIPDGKNVFFSPFSISSAMALLSLGAKGNTKREINKVLHFNQVNAANRSVIHHVYQHLIQTLTSGHIGANVSTASALFGKSDIKVVPEFRMQARKFYDTDFFTMNDDDPEAQINQWTADHTNNMIQKILPPGSISSDVPIVLINAVHFKGNWLEPFNAKRTKLRDFYVRKGEKVQVPTMVLMKDLAYGSNPLVKSRVVELPYEGEDLSMYIFLPIKKSGLTRLVKSLTSEKLMTSLQGLRHRKLEVHLPKFKFDVQFELSDFLKKLGVKDLLSNPDLSGLSPNARAIRSIRHGAAIDVNEEGTEAAGATAVLMGRSGPFEFNVKHPFLFFIIHKPTDVILFAGCIFNP